MKMLHSALLSALKAFGCQAIVYQQWPLWGLNNKTRYFVDIVLQVDRTYIAVECHGAREHEGGVNRRCCSDEKKADAWRQRMGTDLISVHRPGYLGLSSGDGSWQAHVQGLLRPLLENAKE